MIKNTHTSFEEADIESDANVEEEFLMCIYKGLRQSKNLAPEVRIDRFLLETVILPTVQRHEFFPANCSAANLETWNV
ncbi:hypothetical protein ACTXT7_010022 [Hymenolepis weldensis]